MQEAFYFIDRSYGKLFENFQKDGFWLEREFFKNMDENC